MNQHPSSHLASVFILPSYDWAVHRLDSINNRIQVLAGFAATITLGVIALAAGEANFESNWFRGALLDFGITLVVAAVAHYYGKLELINPGILREKWLHKTPERFNADLLFFAGNHFEKNIGLVNQKGRWHLVLTLLFCGEIALLAAWLILPS